MRIYELRSKLNTDIGNLQSSVTTLEGERIKYKDYNFGDVEVISSNFLTLQTFDSGVKYYLGASVINYGTSTNCFAIHADHQKLFLTALTGTKVTNLTVRFVYV